MPSSFQRLGLMVAPALTLVVVGAATWLLTSRDERGWGPMRALPYAGPTAPDATPLNDTAPPPTLLERLTPVQAEIRNSLLPFSNAPLALGAAYRASGETPAAALQCLTSAVYYEAGNEPEAGKRAVAQVILNRTASPSFPHTICAVIQQGAPRPGCQFTFMCDGSLGRPPAGPAWAAAQAVAQAALAGAVDPDVGSATHYHADYVVPLWAPAMVKLVKIGRHIFYRWPGARLLETPAPVASPDTGLNTTSDGADTAALVSSAPPTGAAAGPSALPPPALDAPSASSTTASTPTSMPTVPALSPAPAPARALAPTSDTSVAKPRLAPRRALPQDSLRSGPF